VPSATERDPTSLETASIWAPFFYARTFARVSSGIDGLSFSTRKSTKTRTRAGKVRYVGVSNFSGWQVMKSLAVSLAGAGTATAGLVLTLMFGVDANRSRP
jgi:hypothetical protein